MSVNCRICNVEFKSLITSTHLKRHNMTTAEYVAEYGRDALSSAEHRAQASARSSGSNNPMWGKTHTEESIQKSKNKLKGKPAHNKDKPMSQAQRDNLREQALERNAKWRETGTHPLVGRERSEESKKKNSESQTVYAKANPDKMSERAQKSVETKRDKGYDLGFFRDRTHTTESIEKGKQTSKENRERRKSETRKRIVESIESCGYNIIGVDDDNWFYTVHCRVCDKTFSTTAQNFQPAKKPTYVCQLCPSSEYKKSKAELVILDFVKQLLPNTPVISGDRSVIAPKELDILVPDLNLAIEYCGLNCHGEAPVDSRFSNQGKPRNYHRDKMLGCAEKGISLITIFSDEWVNNLEIVKSVIRNKLGLNNENRIMARKCEIRELSSEDANTFLNLNHLQGSGRSRIRLGLYHEDQLVSVMTFMQGDTSHKSSDWEINRFATVLNTRVVGGASKLFNHFVSTNDVERVVSFSDNRYGDGSTYSRLGFMMESAGEPNYWYIMGNKRFHRYKFAKHVLVEQGYDASKTEWEIQQSRGYDRIWDCGHKKWVWTR